MCTRVLDVANRIKAIVSRKAIINQRPAPILYVSAIHPINPGSVSPPKAAKPITAPIAVAKNLGSLLWANVRIRGNTPAKKRPEKPINIGVSSLLFKLKAALKLTDAASTLSKISEAVLTFLDRKLQNRRPKIMVNQKVDKTKEALNGESASSSWR